jgi:membrane-bound lytic murein transglycosylase D
MSRRARLLALCLIACVAAEARAEPQAKTWSQEAVEGVAVSSESPELRALRLAEHELFGRGPDEAPEIYDPDCVYGVPDALSSDAPPPFVERTGGAVEDLAFLQDLKLPSLPVRWDSRVIDYLLFFKNDRRGRELAGAWLKRMERYGPMIRRVLREHSLPEDLQIVAMVESGYDPQAKSIASALGLWQFVKASGTWYGLRVDRWVDERLDPERSTMAAARHLRDLYERFGSWELTFAAYNMGYGRLVQAIRKFNTNDYWLLSHLEAGMPFETSIYVAKITAMAIVANNPERFGFADLPREPTLAATRVDVPAGTGLGQIARAAGVDAELIKKYNPHLKKGKVPPGEPPVPVYVPQESYDKFAERWNKSHESVQTVSYVTRFGETLEDVARRHKISAAKLRSLNEMDDGEPVKAGLPLLVPATAEASEPATVQPVATVPDKTFRYDDRRRVFYRVAAHDTPDAVARFFDVTVDEIVAWNHVSEHGVLQRDMLLQLFVRPDLDLGKAVVLAPDQVRILTVGSDEFFDFHESQRGRVRVRYRVQPNDTLAKLAERFELSVGSLGRINQFGNNKTLEPDDWIIVYVPEKQVPELTRRGVIERVGAASTSTAVKPAAPTPKPATAQPEATPEDPALPPEPAAEADSESESEAAEAAEAAEAVEAPEDEPPVAPAADAPQSSP